MGAGMEFGLVGALIYIPAACLITLGLLAVWNRWRSPSLRQVIVVTAILVFVPQLFSGLARITGGLDGPGTGYRIWLAIIVAVELYLPVLIPAVLWALQRRGDSGDFSEQARVAGSLLVAYVVLVILVLPAAFFGLVFFFGQEA